jgi:hypothetical protein
MTNNTKGFEIATDIRRHLLRVTLWGFWDVELAKKYRYAMREKIEEIVANGKEWYAIADFTQFYPRSTDVQRIIREQFETAKERGMKKIVYLGEKSAIQLRLDTGFLINNVLEYSFVESEADAIQWLLNESPHKIEEKYARDSGRNSLLHDENMARNV